MLKHYILKKKKPKTCPKDRDTKYQDYADEVLNCPGLTNAS